MKGIFVSYSPFTVNSVIRVEKDEQDQGALLYVPSQLKDLTNTILELVSKNPELNVYIVANTLFYNELNDQVQNNKTTYHLKEVHMELIK